MANWFKRLFGTKEPAIEEPHDWQIVEATNSELGVRGVIRLRVVKPALPPGQPFSCAVEISWPYSDVEQFPSTEVNQQQLLFETALDDLAGANGFSELVQVSTGMGKKEWLYYTSDQSRFMAELNTLLSSHAAYPININFYDDPEWKIWREVAESLSSRNA